ncbi:MAG: hypothetical protein FWE04_03150 [Oscillospiraceae bacterium]|nr:hypothetical protein [Oscillospiraceae bacterium]
MNFKKIAILTLAVVLLPLILTACGGGNNAATQDGINGRWTHVRTTTGDYGEPLELHELADTPPILDIIGDRIIFTTFWGSTIEGVLTETGENSYEVTEIVTRSVDFTWDSDETYFVTYDSTNGLLRYTHTTDIGEDVHYYFTRGGN